MSLGKWTICAVMGLTGASLLIAADKPAPTTAPSTQPVGSRKLTKPWSQLKSLTPEQSEKIEKIHADALVEEKKVHTKELDDILAVLTPEQLNEYKALEKKLKLEATEKRKEAATQP